MRTRFLNIDYFSLAPPQSRETLAFLHLPVPRLPSTFPSAIEDHLRFDSLLNVPLLIERLPINAALSKFLSDVLPHNIDVDFQGFEAASASRDKKCPPSFSIGSVGNRISEQEAVIVFEDNEVDKHQISGSEAETESLNEGEGSALSDKNKSVDKIIQFEAPELDVLLESAWFPEEETMQILSESEIPGVEVNLEMLKPECSMQYTCEVLESISSVDVTPEYYAVKDGYSLEDNISVQNLQHTVQSKFPILEVDEESLGILTCLAMEKNVGSHFDDIRPQNLDTKYHFVMEGQELLGSMKYNIMDFFSVDCLSKQSLVLSNILPEREFIIMLETKHDQENSALQGASQADNSPLLVNQVTFEEFMFLEVDLVQTFEVFYNTQTLDDPETIEWMFKKEFNFKNFDELVVGSEMALIDDKFKSLPVPVISDHGKMISVYVIIGEMLYNLKTHPLSASDGIYLNWDVLEEDKCNSQFYHCCQNLWAKIDLNNIGFDGQSLDDGRVVFDLVFSSDAIGECDTKQSEELQKLLSYCPSLLDDHTIGATLSKPLDDGSPRQGTGVQLAERNAERASLLFKSMSDVSNLDYFLNPQKATAKGHCNLTVESTDANVKVPKLTSTDLKASYGCTGLQSQGWHTVLHRVKLSENMVAIIGNFEKSYLAVLQSETELTKTYNPAIDYFKLLSLPKHKLMECHENGKNMAFIVLCAIKQAAWYLCFYGLHPAGMYVDKLCQSLEYLKSRLGYLQLLIKDENRKVGDKITAVHPSLTVFEEILRSNIKRNGLKVLIVAEEVFWWSLKSLLLSMGLSFNELHGNQSYAHNMVGGTDSKMKDLLISDCLIISYKHVSSLFPFNKFGIILEYGGPYCSSRISDLSPNSLGFPHLHFLNVELDGHAALKALCEGVEMPPTIELENETHLIFDPKAIMMNQKLGKLLNFCPVEQNYDIRSSEAAEEVDRFVPPSIQALKSHHSRQSMESFPEAVIVVNTQSIDKEMIMSRRSTYQVILAMEKGGTQVVERDLDLPVDIIISSAICLVWYDNRNLGKKATPLTEASSSLPLCIENIATNDLTLLSFSFSGCFLVFEGDVNFISTVMESSDGLYAAGASLGIDLQIFFSYSSELTNEIIVSCVKYGTKLTRGLYPRMPDSVTIAESFLMAFPSINPLTAHAILSSGAVLCEFLEWSHEHRVRVLEKYSVPEQSIALFSAFCRYGEREDSKSIMTDCSSSVSSGPDSYRCQVDYERKRKKKISSPQEDELCFDELLQYEPLDQVVNGYLDSSTLSKHCNPGTTKDMGRFSDLTKTSLCMSDLFGQKQGFDVTTIRNPSVSRPSGDSRNFKAPEILEQLNKSSSSLKDKASAPNDILNTDMISKNLTWHGLSNSKKVHEDITGKFVDLTDTPVRDKNFSFMDDSMDFLGLMTETEEDHRRKNKIARRLSSDKGSHPEANSSNIWSSLKDAGMEVGNYPEPYFVKDDLPLDVRHSEKISDEGLTQASMRNLQGLPFQEEMSHLGGTPLSRALRSASPLKKSPWTIEFINRIKEKSKLRQKSLSCENAAPCFGDSGSMSRVPKRRSPSIIEFFKYQGSRPHGNTPEQKRQKQSVQSSNPVKNGKCLDSLLPTWTPNDKKARKTLTFAMNERGSQTKLVWSDGTPGLTKKLRHQTQ